MTHGSPRRPTTAVYPGSEELAELADYAADYLILGHTHYQMAERLGCLVINLAAPARPATCTQRPP